MRLREGWSTSFHAHCTFFFDFRCVYSLAQRKERRQNDLTEKLSNADEKDQGMIAKKAEAAARMIVTPTPGFSVIYNTDMPDYSQDEIDRLRKERMDRQAAKKGKRLHR